MLAIFAFRFRADNSNLCVGLSILATPLLFGTASVAMLHTASGSLLPMLHGISHTLFCLILAFHAGFTLFWSEEFRFMATNPVQSLRFLRFLSLCLLIFFGGTGFFLT